MDIKDLIGILPDKIIADETHITRQDDKIYFKLM